MTGSNQKTWHLFPRTLILFITLGITPILLTTVIFALPVHWQIAQYKTLVGILLIISTVSTLCLAGIVTQMLKRPINKLMAAQKEIEQGNMGHRLLAEGSQELRVLADGFNRMAQSVELAAQREKIIAEEKSFSALASQVVHDLRSPLTSLQTAAQYFSIKENLSSDDSEMLGLLTRGTKKVRLIADDLLERRNKHRLSPSIDINETLAEIAQDYKATVAAEIEIKLNLSPSKLLVAAQKIDVQRAVSNIVNNALEAIGTEGTLIIKTDKRGFFAAIEITDTGPGMTEEILNKALEGNFTHAKPGGSGIGMTIVREVVKKYHGILSAESTPGTGTTFTIKLPTA